MPDLEHAKELLTIAGDDLRALRAMADDPAFSTRVFGFHAQQAAEKTLKAWLSLAGIAYPKVHDLEALFEMVVDSGQGVPPSFRALERLTDFAVQFRYSAYVDLGEDLDRAATVSDVGALVEHVQRLAAECESRAEEET